MKKITHKILVFSFLLVFFGCQKDDSPASTEVVKTKVNITRIDISSIPTYNGSLLWDASNNPDIYIEGYDELGSLVASSTTLWNYIPSISYPFSVSFTSPISTTDLTNTIFKVKVWDDDSDIFNNDDKIGEVPFSIHDYTIGTDKYPSYAVKSDGLGTIVTIYMTWE